MDPKELRRLLSEAKLPGSVDVSQCSDGGYGLHDSSTGAPIAFSWERAEVVMALLNAAPALLDVVEAAELVLAEPDDEAFDDLRSAVEALHAR